MPASRFGGNLPLDAEADASKEDDIFTLRASAVSARGDCAIDASQCCLLAYVLLMRSRSLALTLVAVLCAASSSPVWATPTTIAPEDLAPKAVQQDTSTLLGIDALTDKELKQRFRKVNRLERDYKELGGRAKQIRERVRTLEAQASDTDKLVQETEVRSKRAQSQVLRSQGAVNVATAQYVETVGAMSFGAAGASNPAPEDLLALVADSESIGDATLVYSTAASLINDRQHRLDHLSDLSDIAAKAAASAETEASAALDARRVAADTLRDAVALQETLSDLKAATRNQAKDARAAAEDQLNRLLDAGAWVAPDADPGFADRPLAHRMVSLARTELEKGVAETPLGSNNGEDISRYRTATQGAYPGAPWCAYFVSYIAARAGSPVGPTGAGMGAVVSVRQWLTAKSQYFSAASSARPRPGDLVFWPQHIGIVVSYDAKTDQITTVEGNSSDRVNSRTTGRSSVLGYGRLDGKVKSSGGGAHTVETPENTL